MNGTKTYQKRLRWTITWAVLATAAASCFALVEDRQRAWAEEIQQGPTPYQAAHLGPVENFFAGLR